MKCNVGIDSIQQFGIVHSGFGTMYLQYEKNTKITLIILYFYRFFLGIL